MTTIVFWFSIIRLDGGAANWYKRPYTYCSGDEKQLVSAPTTAQGVHIFMSMNENYKIYGAILGTALMAFGIKELAGEIYHAETPEKPGYLIEVAEAGTGGEAAAGGEEAPAVSLGTLLASADATKGQAVAKNCASCHDFTKGGPNKTGPNLYGVVMRKHGTHEGFTYSEAMAAKSADDWSYEALNEFIKSPKTAVPGTKMAYGGLKKDADRANLLAYLATLSDAPVAFPAP